MNKVILGLILSVCVLGMALIMLNEKLNRKPDNDPKPGSEVIEQATIDDNKKGGLAIDGNKKGTIVAPQTNNAEKIKPEKTKASLPPVPPKPNVPTPEKPGAKSSPSVTEKKEAKPSPAVVDKSTKPAHAELEIPAIPALPPVIDLPASKPSLLEPAPLRNQEETKPANTTGKPVAKAETLPEQGKKETVSPENREKDATTVKNNTNDNKTKQDAPAQAERNITRFVVLARDKGATVRLVGSSSLRQYKMNTLANPDRLVVDLDGKWDVKAPGIPKNQIIGNIRLGKYDKYTKVVIDLKTKPKNTKIIFNKDNTTMDIRLDQ